MGVRIVCERGAAAFDAEPVRQRGAGTIGAGYIYTQTVMALREVEWISDADGNPVLGCYCLVVRDNGDV